MRTRVCSAITYLSVLAALAGCRESAPRESTPGVASDTAAASDSLSRPPAWLLARDLEERTANTKLATLHDFQFTDMRGASGITFVARAVDDAGKAYKADHYDHGTGVCAADVDNDSKTDLFFVSQLGTSELWRNAGGGKFSNATASSGLAIPDAIAIGCAFGDIDNDGLADLMVTTVRHGNHLFKNVGNGAFKDVTVDAGVGYVGHSSGALFFDYDGDGLLDLLVTNVGVYTSNEKGPGGYYIGLDDAFHGHTHQDRDEASILYRNAGNGKFTDVSKATGFNDKSWSGDATIIDANEDGRPDIYMLNMMGQNHLWLNVDGKAFRDETATYFPRTPWGAMGSKVFDFNGDGKLDLYVTDMHSDMFAEVSPGDWFAEFSKSESRAVGDDVFPTGRAQFVFGNALFAHPVAGAATPYREVSDSLRVETYWPWGPSVDDLNADGWDDILVIGSMNFPYRYGINSVLLNDAGRKFTHTEFTLGVEPRANGATQQEWFSIDCSAQGADRLSKSCVVCLKEGSTEAGCRADATPGHYTMIASRGSRSSVVFDVDGDGDLDIVTNEMNAAPQVLISNLAAKHPPHAVSIRLRGTASNRQGLGAQITVILPDKRRVLKVNDGKSGYLAQSDLPLYFGLGDADHADAIEVRWPSGKTQTVPGPVKAGQTLTITEP